MFTSSKGNSSEDCSWLLHDPAQWTGYSSSPIPLDFDGPGWLVLIPPSIEWFCPVIQPGVPKSSSSSSHSIFSPVCGNLLSPAATPVSCTRASRALPHQADGPVFFSFSTQYDFFQLRFNRKHIIKAALIGREAAESVPQTGPAHIPSPCHSCRLGSECSC